MNRRVIVVLSLVGMTGCKDSLGGFGTGAHARASADQLFTALADRHAEIVRNAKYDYARVQISRGAFSPSRVFDDSATWTGISGKARLLETFGTYSEQKYQMSSRAGVSAPVKLGDGRHATTLTKLSDSEFRWDTSVDFAIGSVRPAEIALMISRLLAGGEGLGERDARVNLAASMPRTSAALGTLFSLDTLRPTVLPDGSTAASISIGVHTDQLKGRFPNFSDYTRKYLDPARFHAVISDRTGAVYLDIASRDKAITLRVRTLNGHLVPLAGPLRPLADTMVAVVEFTDKVKLFHVGFHDLVLEFINGGHGDTERWWAFSARKEPQWNLPFITARLLRSPLRRPFAGEGALFRIGIRADPADATTVLFRQARLDVQESAILKFINSLTNTAMDDFGARVEKEENQWLRELFVAMRDDARGAIAP